MKADDLEYTLWSLMWWSLAVLVVTLSLALFVFYVSPTPIVVGIVASGIFVGLGAMFAIGLKLDGVEQQEEAPDDAA